MTPAEAQNLLSVAAAFDNRKPSEEAAIAWSHALADLPYGDCRDAVVAHYRTSSEWLMPAKVIAEVKRVRGQAHRGPPAARPPAAARTPCVRVRSRRASPHERKGAPDDRSASDEREVIDCDAAYGELKPPPAIPRARRTMRSWNASACGCVRLAGGSRTARSSTATRPTAS
jgi:hypothetical protein